MSSFTKTLTNWYRGHKRDLPWRRTKDPYPVWLSEIILQQTRVEQGLPYWQRFMVEFPTVDKLANASEEQVLRLWQGLGYYSRARNLHATARYVHHHLGGQFPQTYVELLKLKGIGPYTAAAIASICFNESTPVVDGNVFRFAARYFGIHVDISSSNARKRFETLLAEHVPTTSPGDFNQAMMEFGARVCAPSPMCQECTFQLGCYAKQHNAQKALPVKTKKLKVKDRHFNYLIFKQDEYFFMKPRTGQDIWKGLYDFPLVEQDLNEDSMMGYIKDFLGHADFIVTEVSEPITHLLSHQRLIARFYEIELQATDDKSLIQIEGIRGYSIEELLNLPKPKLIVNHLAQRGIK